MTLRRNPDFLKLWAGQAISELGSTVTREAIPLLAVLTLGASPFEMGILSALGGLPALVFGIFAGVWVDRLRRRPLMIAADLGRAILLGLIPLTAALGMLHIELVYGVMILAGLLGVFFSTAYRAYLPALIERSQLVEGNSKLALTSSLAEVGGAGLAGVLVQVIGAPFAILLDALSFLVSTVSLLLIRKPEPPVQPSLEQPSVLREAAEGLRAVSGRPVLRALLGAAATSSLLGNIFAPLYGLYAIRELGLSPAALGLTIALGGVSGLAGSLLAGRALRRFGLGPTLVSMLALTTLTALLIPLSGSIPGSGLFFLGLAQLLGDGLDTIYSIHSISLRQSVTPDRLLGRVNASLELVSSGVAPLGALLGGVLAVGIGVQNALYIAALHGLLASLWILASPIWRMRNIPAPVDINSNVEM
jgi:predicted MFS family arabinose efflux permease